jgi:predicted unusual protein kinase regulating ubiquinone biosynthesis (AarF/ABC1/UbiB family)
VNVRAYWRFFVVARQFLPLLLAYARDRRRFLLFGSGRRVSPDQHHERAVALLDSMLTLGPTFIKLGQLLSTRPDVLPPEYIEEFSKLQDRVPPAPWEEVREVVEDELGPVEKAFAEFDSDAVSGASLGQVYYAETNDGTPVAVKVRRPGVEDLVEADLRVIKWSLPVLLYFIDDARSFSLETLADEFSKTIREEMDYEREGRMLEEIRGNFEDDETVCIPAVIDSHSNSRILTMEYVEGTKIDDVETLDAKGIDRTELAKNLERAYFRMIIDDGVFHADPHPGNLAVQDDGTLVFYDFGMSGRVDPFVQDKIVEFYTAVANQDIPGILDALVEMGTLSPDADRQLMGDVLELAIADARGEDIEQYRVNQIVQQVEDTIYDFPFRLPPNLALVLRVATVVEGVCVTLNPDVDFVSVATDSLHKEGYLEATAREFVSQRASEVRSAAESAIRTPPKLERVLDTARDGNLEVQADLRDSRNTLDKLARRLVYGLLVTSGLLSTAILYAFGDLYATAAAGAFTLWFSAVLVYSFRRKRGVTAQPQFTRQNLRQRRQE